MIPDDKQRDEFKAGLKALSDEDIQLNLDVGIYGREWKRSLAKQELEQRRHDAIAATAKDRWLTKPNILVAAAMGVGVLVAWLFG